MTKLQYSITNDCLQGYMLHQKEYNDPVGQSWFSITTKDIDEYVMTYHYYSYTNRPISNSDQGTQTTGNVHNFKNDPNVKQKSMSINVSDIYTDLFLNLLCGDIGQVVNSKLCKNINPN